MYVYVNNLNNQVDMYWNKERYKSRKNLDQLGFESQLVQIFFWICVPLFIPLLHIATL